MGVLRLLRRPGVLLGGLVVVVVAAAGVAMATGAVVVSQNPSPFATVGCGAIDSAQTSQVSTTFNYLNSEEEPWVAVDPTDGNHLVGAWQQDRWNDGGANGLASAYSTTGGSSWSAVVPLPFTSCFGAGGLAYQRASDPWVSIGPGKPASYGCAPTAKDCSTVYQVAIPFDETSRRTAVAASVSYDLGATYTHTTTLIADPCSGVHSPGYVCGNPKSFILNDKESVTADPTQPGNAYVVWDRLVAPPASPPGFFHELAFKGPAFISRTTDYGQTWSAPEQIVTTPSIDQTIGNIIVVDPTNGALYNFFEYIQNLSNSGGNRGISIGFVKSTDHGLTWGPPQTVAADPSKTVVDANNVDPTTNTAPAPLRTAQGLPQPAISSTGQLYVVWEGLDSATGTDQAYITTSNDGGAHWSTPALVDSAYTSRPAYTPAVAVAPGGTVGVTYYQWDAATTSGAEPTVLYIQKSTSAGSSTTAPTFGSRTAISSEFNGLAPPYSETGYFLGDYEGLTANTTGFIPLNVLGACDSGGSGTQPSCRALKSVINPTDVTPTNNNATDVYAFPGS
jgi:hypothetical protein